MKKLNKIMFFLTFVFVFNIYFLNVEAKNEQIYKSGDYYMKIDKDQMETYTMNDSKTEYVAYKITDSYLEAAGLTFFNDKTGYLYTDLTKDKQLEEDTWWETIYACNFVNTDFTIIFSYGGVAAYTDSSISSYAEDNDYEWYNFFFGESSVCKTLYLEDKKVEIVETCKVYDEIIDEIENLNDGINDSSKISKYYEFSDQLKIVCKDTLGKAGYEDPCVKKCISISDTIKSYNELFGISTQTDSECGLSSDLIKWIKNILKWVKYILPVLVIILGIIDFIKAIASGSDDEMKKAQGRFIKRLIAAALLFLIPALIEFILNVFNIESTFCGITD